VETITRSYDCSASELKKQCDEELRRMIGSCRNVGIYFDRPILGFFYRSWRLVLFMRCPKSQCIRQWAIQSP
jgi:hypothetical protein